MKWTDGVNSVIGDGTWAFSGNDYYPVTTGSNIGDATHRIGTIFMASIFDYSNDLNFYNGTSNTMTLTTSGNLGIGEPTPTARLSVLTPDNLITSYGVRIRQDVTGDDLFTIKGNGYSSFSARTNLGIGDNANNTTRLNIQGINGGSATDNIMIAYNYGGTDIPFIIKNSGYVGVGVNNQLPTARLHIEGLGTTSATSFLKGQKDDTTVILDFTDGGSFQLGRSYNSGYNNINFIDFISPSAFSTQQRFSIGFNSIIYANIDPSSTIAGGAIHIGSGGTYQYYTNANFGRVEVNNYDTTKNLGWIWDNPTGTTYLLSLIKTDSSERILTVDQNTGNLGIGTGSSATIKAKIHTVGVDSITNVNQRLEPVTNVTEDTTGNTVNTTDNTVTTIETFAIDTDTVVMIESYVTCRKTAGAGAGTVGQGNGYIRTVKAKNVGGVVTIGVVQSSFTSEDINVFDTTFVVSGTNVILNVTGSNNNNVTWNSITKKYKVA